MWWVTLCVFLTAVGSLAILAIFVLITRLITKFKLR